MKRTSIAVMALLVLAGAWKLGGVIAVASDQSNDNNIAILDNCDAADPTWTPVGGCTLKPHQGDVSRVEFGQLLFSPLGGGPMGVLIGHPSWRNEPSYLSTEQGKTIRVKNEGGRPHTFTQVAQFGGGRVPPGLNGALTPAPECVATLPANDLLPGDSVEISGLDPGLHKYQCCIHPWMHAAIRVN
jgi:plastocyanin